MAARSDRESFHGSGNVLRLQAERFRDLWEAAPFAMVIVDEQGEIMLVNAGAESLFGYTREELVGQRVELLVPERSRPQHDRHREQFVAENRTRRMGIGMDLLARRKDGTEFPVEIGLSTVHTDHGVLISSAISDITGRKRAETAIAHLAAIVESSDDAIVGETLDGRITTWNPAAERTYGYSAAETIGGHVSMLFPSAEQQAELEDMLEEVRAGGRVNHFETIRRHKDGHIFDVSVTVSPIRNPEGAVVGASATARDITERKRAADALAEAEEQFRGAFEEGPIGMALIDLRGRITKVNEALCQITGYPGEDLERMACEAIMHPDDAPDILGQLTEIWDGTRTLHASELRFVHSSGHAVWVALQLTLIRSRDGRPLRSLAQIQDITDRKRFENKLQDLADHDSLTGLLNRRAFARELDTHAALASRYGAEGALLMLDLDHFKYINDTLGHQAGDSIIIRAAELLVRRLRDSDIVARLGGDEFAILLPKADAAAAERVGLQLMRQFADQPITVAGAGGRALTASIGVATFEPGLGGEDVLVNADLAMYDAKEAGRNRVALHKADEHDQARMKGRLSWVERIRSALEEERFSLLAQPIVDYSTGCVSQYELLLRMIDEHGDLIPPGAFLYIAERLDLVEEIDAWVVRNAIGLLAEDNGPGQGLPLHVNLSGLSLGQPKLLELIECELGRTGIAPTLLTFEITETAAVRHITHARRFSERLNELGCKLALDDFGAGFGSFYYLKHLPFDYLKIDGEFVRNCRSSKTDRLVIEAVVGIARGLGKSTIAEFVGDDETARLLIRLGVDYGQGRHHGKPGPIVSFDSRVEPAPTG